MSLNNEIENSVKVELISLASERLICVDSLRLASIQELLCTALIREQDPILIYSVIKLRSDAMHQNLTSNHDIRQSIGTDIVIFDVFLQMQLHDRRIDVRVLANLNPLLLKITVIIYKNFALNKNPYQAQHSIFILILCVLFILLRPIANIQQTNIFLFAT